LDYIIGINNGRRKEKGFCKKGESTHQEGQSPSQGLKGPQSSLAEAKRENPETEKGISYQKKISNCSR
jgi:hypothetical protein